MVEIELYDESINSKEADESSLSIKIDLKQIKYFE
jgi:hypothetical protein